MTAPEQLAAQGQADESRRAGDEDTHRGRRSRATCARPRDSRNRRS
jgi:hypothetical protein